MKLLLILISITLINEACSSNIEQEHMVIQYLASTREAYYEVILKNKTISIIKQRGSDPIIKAYPKGSWEKIIQELKKVDIEHLEHFNPPSNKHHFDGSQIATLKITKNNKNYKSQSFDHGNPPKEIAALVKEILSIAKNIE